MTGIFLTREKFGQQHTEKKTIWRWRQENSSINQGMPWITETSKS